MLRKLIAFIDGIGDRLHPVTMLMARQGFSPETRGVGTIILFVTIWIAALLTCVFRIPVEGFVKNMSDGPSGASHIVPSLVVNMYSLILAFSMIGCPVCLRRLLRMDPTMHLTPLSDRDTLVGAWRYGIWVPVYLAGLVAPISATLHYLRIFSTDGAVFYPFVTVLFGTLYLHLFLPLIAAVRTRLEEMFVYGFGIMMAAGIYFGSLIPIIGLAMLPPPLLPFATLAERRCWVPVLLAAVIGSYLLAWRLIDFNLARHQSFSWKMAVIFIVYFLWTLTLFGLWLGLWRLLG